MSESNSGNVLLVNESGDDRSHVTYSNLGVGGINNLHNNVRRGKIKRRQYSLSCSVPFGSDLYDLNDEKLHSKDDCSKHINISKPSVTKDNRKNRTGLKEHKKGGGGGKGTWNKQTEVYDDLQLDKNDPCYESDEESFHFEDNIKILVNEQFDDCVTNWIQEYFENQDASEVVRNLSEINLVSDLRSRLPYLCILQALQRKPAQCELTSRLLCDLIGQIMIGQEMTNGFDLLIQEMSELTIDCPKAPEIIGRFIARAIADDLLPPKYIQSHKADIENEDQIRALAKAENLLSLDHGYARLDTVWGLPGGERPTKMLTSKIRILLAEYLDSDDGLEAARCLRELEAPHFHHELVFQAILMVLEKSTDFVCNKMISLLDMFCTSVIITIDQFEQGINRIYNQMSDIQLDVPAAYILLERFVNLAVRKGTFFPPKLYSNIPKNNRTRYASLSGVYLP